MSLDERLFSWLHYRAGECPPLDGPLVAWARYGAVAEVGLMALVGLWHGAAGRRTVWRCLLAVAAMYGLSELIGLVVRRPRPFASEPAARALLSHGSGRSFPSRHVASAVAMSLVVRPVAPRIAAAMGLVAVGLGLSRVRTGLHYPSDVAAGALLGGIVGRAFAK